MDINNKIEHTLLKADASDEDITRLCEEAIEYDFYAVCVNPCYVAQAKGELAGTKVKVCTVVGFPLGANRTEVKVLETKKAIEDGADEIDMVMNIGALKSEDTELVEEDIRAVVLAAEGKPVKVILETALLSREEKIYAVSAAKDAGAKFVKTSTGFSTGGATVEDVYLLSTIVGEDMGIKASGGIKTYEQAKSMLDHGASRIGTSSGVAMVKN